MKSWFSELVKIVKFAITGVMNTLVDMAVFFLLSSLLGVNVYASQVCGYATGTLNSYLVNRSWTFHSKNRFFSAEAVKFFVGNAVVLALSLIPIRICTGVFALNSLYTKLITTCFTLALNFCISRFWIFKENNDKGG